MDLPAAARIAGGEPFRPARSDWLQAGAIALSLVVLYAVTAPRTIALEDDALFVLSSYFMSGAHPPGYPLHALLGKLFTLLPFGSIAYRVHLLSALFGGLSCGILWLCARTLFADRFLALFAAFGFGLTPVFWSQAIIAEVYTLNTFLFFVLVYMGLRGSPLPAMALVFGLSLANHWPLMLLAAPAFAFLLWPRLRQILRRSYLLVPLAAVGLLPYLVMMVRSWSSPVSYFGPIESFRELWYVVSREVYAGVDVSAAASWIDRLKFFRFLGEQILFQFAVVGAVFAAIGAVVQWRFWGGRISAFLSVGFLMPTVVLILMLKLDYDALHKHIFHVYPLPAYGIAALWMGLGYGWLAQRMSLRVVPAGAAAGAALLALMFALGCQSNLRSRYDWPARYAAAVFNSLPRDSVLFVQGDSDIGPTVYFHLVEGWRPDITIYQWQGLIIGSRLAHPLRTSYEAMIGKVRALIDREIHPVAFTHVFLEGYARRDRFLYMEVDKTSGDRHRITVDVPEALYRFFEESVLLDTETDPWTRFYQSELRLGMARLIAMSLPRSRPPDARAARYLATLSRDFHGALGLAEGLLANKEGYSVSQVARYLDLARELMPEDVARSRQANFFELRGYLRLGMGEERGATEDLETAVSLWPKASNRAASSLADVYTKTGNESALKALRARLTP